MLQAIDDNAKIIVGGYTDKRGGVCPMLAAHRNGGRTNFASFARAWDRFTGAGRKPRRASRREIRSLRTYLELSLLRDEQDDRSIAELAADIRKRRRSLPAAPATATADPRPVAPKPDTGDHDRRRELRRRPFWAWLIPTRRYDVYAERVAAAEEQLSEQRAIEVLADCAPDRDRAPEADRAPDREPAR
jgi:hypothetical protein